jgi:hypothetical protein
MANGASVTEQKLVTFQSGLGGKRFKIIFEVLLNAGLKPVGKSNSQTLIFRWKDSFGNEHDVVAFRQSPDVLSFPRSFWRSRKDHRSSLCSSFGIFEQPPVSANVGPTQESEGQVSLTMSTLERVKTLANDICAYVSTSS